MSGHSKWATTKRQKAVTDAKKGAIFTKLGNLITIAAGEKGPNPEANFSLRIAIEKAKGFNMPKENIERAIKKGTGELAGEIIEELIYEGFGPAGSQFIIKSLTSNKNRSAATVRHIFTKYGGSIGSVIWNFGKKGVIRITNQELKNKNMILDDFELKLIDAGAEDIIAEEEGIIIYTKIAELQKIKRLLDSLKINVDSAEIEYVAKELQKIDEGDKKTIEEFINELENNEDVSDYYHNISNI